MRPVASIAFVVLLSITAAACQTNGWGDKQTGGMLLGAGLGGLLGSQVGSGEGQLAATALGVLLGAWVGNEMGASLDRADEIYARRAAERAFEYNRTGDGVSWSNPDSGHYGTVTPRRTYSNAVGEFCREYQQEVVVGGKRVHAYGTACRNPDGSWRIVNN